MSERGGRGGGGVREGRVGREGGRREEGRGSRRDLSIDRSVYQYQYLSIYLYTIGEAGDILRGDRASVE